MDWIDLAQDKDRWRAVVKMVMNFMFSLYAGNFLTSWRTVSFSRRTLVYGFIYLFICSGTNCVMLPSVHVPIHTSVRPSIHVSMHSFISQSIYSFIFVYLKMLQVTQMIWHRVWDVCWIAKDLKISCLDIIWSTSPTFSYRNLSKTTNMSVRTAGLPS
jgi:hypothetical protein